jgi:hypothetical protein
LSLVREGRPLKRWRYVAIFCEELMACAAEVRVGPFGQRFWAIVAGTEERLRERTRMLTGRDAVELNPGLPGRAGAPPAPGLARVRVRDAGVLLDVRLQEDGGVEARGPHGRGEVWTRKQAGIPARGILALDGRRPREIEALAVIDDTAGYHARHTEWSWTAGVGEGSEGIALAWNLVTGVNDPPTGSERAVWIAGRPQEAPPVSFAGDLSKVWSADGSELSFRAVAERSRRENLLIVRSDYRARFGSFSGALPGGVALARGLGVVEHHRARW